MDKILNNPPLKESVDQLIDVLTIMISTPNLDEIKKLLQKCLQMAEQNRENFVEFQQKASQIEGTEEFMQLLQEALQQKQLEQQDYLLRNALKLPFADLKTIIDKDRETYLNMIPQLLESKNIESKKQRTIIKGEEFGVNTEDMQAEIGIILGFCISGQPSVQDESKAITQLFTTATILTALDKNVGIIYGESDFEPSAQFYGILSELEHKASYGELIFIENDVRTAPEGIKIFRRLKQTSGTIVTDQIKSRILRQLSNRVSNYSYIDTVTTLIQNKLFEAASQLLGNPEKLPDDVFWEIYDKLINVNPIILYKRSIGIEC